MNVVYCWLFGHVQGKTWAMKDEYLDEEHLFCYCSRCGQGPFRLT